MIQLRVYISNWWGCRCEFTTQPASTHTCINTHMHQHTHASTHTCINTQHHALVKHSLATWFILPSETVTRQSFVCVSVCVYLSFFMSCSYKQQHNTRLHGSSHVGFVFRAGSSLDSSRWSCSLTELQHTVWSGRVWVSSLQASSSGTKCFCSRAEFDMNNTTLFHQMFVILTFF